MQNFIISTNKSELLPKEAVELWVSLGWGKRDDYNENNVIEAIKNTSFLVFARNAQGQLIGLVRVLSDGVIYTAIADFAIRSDYRDQEVGVKFMEEVENKYRGTGIFIDEFKNNEEFFVKCGYMKRDNMIVLAKKF